MANNSTSSYLKVTNQTSYLNSIDSKLSSLDFNTDELELYMSNIALQLDTVSATALNQTYTNSNLAAILVDTSNLVIQMDNLTRIAGVDNYSENVSSGLSVLGAVRNDSLGSLVSSNKELTYLQVNPNGALYSDIVKIPVVGSQGNLSNAITTVGANEKSSVVNTIYCNNITIFGNCSDSCTITLQTSIDNINFYDTSYTDNVPGAGGDFYINANSAGQYHRLNYSASGRTITATLCAV
jgi:hypothetical protein